MKRQAQQTLISVQASNHSFRKYTQRRKARDAKLPWAWQDMQPLGRKGRAKQEALSSCRQWQAQALEPNPAPAQAPLSSDKLIGGRSGPADINVNVFLKLRFAACSAHTPLMDVTAQSRCQHCYTLFTGAGAQHIPHAYKILQRQSISFQICHHRGTLAEQMSLESISTQSNFSLLLCHFWKVQWIL